MSCQEKQNDRRKKLEMRYAFLQADGWVDRSHGIARALNLSHINSPNFGERSGGTSVSLIVIHAISLPPEQFGKNYVELFFSNQLNPLKHPYFQQVAEQKVSAHFYIRRNGRVIQFVSTKNRAWHAGDSSWQGRENCNDYSIGIELEGCDSKPFCRMQYRSLNWLINCLRANYPIDDVVGHFHVAPDRKTDPGPFFDWQCIKPKSLVRRVSHPKRSKNK